jgi:plastocyanin
MAGSRRAGVLLFAAVLIGLGLPAAASALPSLNSVLATTSPQITMIAIPNGAGTTQSSQGFSPGSVTVVIGVNNTVTWTDNDNRMDANGYEPNHIVAADDKSFTSNSLAIGDQFTYTYTAPGTYSYHCNIHAWMNGVVVVKGTAPTTPEFPLPFAVLLVALGAAAAVFTLTRHRQSGLPSAKAP